jgi:uncharacterized protein YqeY
MLLDQIKARMFAYMKQGAALEKEILRVAIGEITTEAARPGRSGNDDEAQAILRKLIKSNDETIAALTDSARKAELERENQTLAEFLPRSLGVDEIVQALEPAAAAIRAAGNDGQATGIAMKHLKAAALIVEGKTVTLAVQKLRQA